MYNHNHDERGFQRGDLRLTKRNVMGKIYKTGVNFGRDLVSNSVAVGDPRTIGLVIRAKF
jgi:hypothetical protein